ncbi:P-selectin glycoprotein ligand 1-like [Brachionichthys hirsutus]|uniref:P-selectin glycoprotein ligand 1-like n=1 Tax=Brachionichthys hirsutus TaxID=412623 RepID=UPI0036049B9B
MDQCQQTEDVLPQRLSVSHQQQGRTVTHVPEDALEIFIWLVERTALRLAMRMDLALVWAVSAFCVMASVSDLIPETISPAEPKETTAQPTNARGEPDTQRVPTYRPADGSTSAPPAKREGTSVPRRNDGSGSSAASLVAMRTVAAPASSSGQRLHRTSHSAAITEPVKSPEDQSQERSPPPSIGADYSAAASASSTSSPGHPARTPTVIQNLIGTSVIQNLVGTSAPGASTESPASAAAPHSTVSAASSQPRSAAAFSTAGGSATGGSKFLIPKTKLTTTAAKIPPSAAGEPCSNRAAMTRCLVVIASLAGVATAFMVSTIVLCARLSTSRYEVRTPPEATEMVSISALRPDMSYSYLRSRDPARNGILVMHGAGDSDEDGGDNLTLSSFLPDNDRLV